MLALPKLSRREKQIGFISLVLVVSIFFDKVIFSPVKERLKNLNGQIVVQEKKLAKSRRILSQDDLILKEYEKYAQGIKQDNSNEEEVASLLSIIEKMANDSFVSVVDMKPSNVESHKFYKKYVIRIEAEAKIGYLADLIYQLEKSPQLLRVTELRLFPKKKESSALRIYMTITQVLLSDVA
ncbi:MAG: type 4a pilus biogenesis protein PilO [Candidatus Omnitrophica bacterium]|nr:type 4a pilus biogenesis protein PilO [Candidatus Omnitrophota bacterium]